MHLCNMHARLGKAGRWLATYQHNDLLKRVPQGASQLRTGAAHVAGTCTTALHSLAPRGCATAR